MVLVGKGITFDTGGLSIKPGEAMVNMKRDMTGGAVVMAVHGRARAPSAARCGSIGLVAAAENAVGGNALRPGDVVRHYGGRTTEVTNTDAEGRLVLADAMAYAVAELEPAVARRRRHAHRRDQGGARPADGGFFANDDALADALAEAARRRGRAAVAVPAGRGLRGQALLQGRRRRQRRRAARARSPPRCSSSTSPATCPWAHLDVASAGDAPDRHLRVDQGPDRLRRPAAARLARALAA